MAHWTVSVPAVLGLMCAVGLATSYTHAKVEMLPGAQGTRVDRQIVEEILAIFRATDEAVHARDLDGVMAIYAETYNYHGLTKADMRKVWADLFDEYHDISSTHIFSNITKVGAGSGTTIEVTCSGSLWAVSKTTGLRIPIDSWHEEIHYLTREQGGWRIRGNVGETPKVLPFGTAPHPLF